MSGHELENAVRELDAVPIEAGEYAGEWAYYDDATRRYWLVTEGDLENFDRYLHSPDPEIRADAYSHWCAATTAREMPMAWEPGSLDPESTALSP